MIPALSDPVLGGGFLLAAAVSLGASWLLVGALERVGARFALSEALLGMLAALAADAPEITTAVTALLRGDQHTGAGVIIGSNVFNLAALIGLSGVVAGSVALHPRVIELAGAVALWVAAAAVAVVLGLPPLAGLLLVLAVFLPYLAALGVRRERLAWSGWLLAAVSEEEHELEVAVHPPRGRPRDGALALLATAVVVAASVAMEHTASELGDRHAVPSILVGALVLAAVTSLPNAVAGVYLAARGRGAAALSTSLNSNAINVLAGLLVPTTLLGIAAPSTPTTFIAAANVGMTLLALLTSYVNRGLRRTAGVAILAVYAVFVAVLVAIA